MIHTDSVMQESVKLLFSKDQIKEKIKEIAEKISGDYEGKELVLIGILKGSFIFLADLARSITIPLTIDFARISSYGSDTVSSGKIHIIKDIEISLEGKEAIIVEDIVDTGLTLFHYAEALKKRKPRSVKICSLIDKVYRREKRVEIDYAGFTVKEGFLVGYGLDLNEFHRHLPGIYRIKE